MEEKIPTLFDKKNFFEKECRPLLEKLNNLCSTQNIPFYFEACVKNTEENSEYISDGVLCGSRDINLTEDRITKHLLVTNGFKVVCPQEMEEIIMNVPIDDDEMLFPG